MALVIQTNTAAITAQKNINTNSAQQNQALNRLSSGFRINSASDDAAGFAISSKLDATGSRLKSAAQNATQAGALVKTAEAGVNEIQNMIVRLQALAVQAASANNSQELTKLDAERGKLTSEIDKIANSSTFNGVNLLNGLDANSSSVAGTASTMTMTAVSASGTVGGLSITASAATFSENATFTVTQGVNGEITSVTSDLALTNATTGVAIADAGVNLMLAGNGGPGAQAGAGAVTVQGIEFTSVDTTGTAGGATAGVTTSTNAATGGAAATLAGQSTYTAALIFQVGGENSANNQVTVNLQNKYTTAGLNIVGDLTTASSARTYIDTAKAALDTLITQRADLGATQNQLNFVSANLATSIEQITASVSSIRDADIAVEIANFTKSQILVQAGTAMLAQANQASQNVLRLFQ